MSALLPAVLVDLAVRNTDFPELINEERLPQCARECIEQVVEELGDVPESVRRAAVPLLLDWASDQRRIEQDEAALALLDAIEAGDVDEDGDPIPYPRYRGL